MAFEIAKANLIWEDNPDTSLNSCNLSKMLDYQSESKFIYYTDLKEDYSRWTELTFESSIDDFSGYTRAEYVGKIVYNMTTFTAKKIVKNADGSYSAIDYNSPHRRLLKILANTKVSMSFVKDGVTKYNSFDIGASDKLFSSDHLLTESRFQTNSTYDIYLYYHISYGDYAQIKIMNVADNSWKTSAVDSSSPSGYKVISYRKIGGFRTDETGYIVEDSLWDISTLHNEMIVKSLKKYDSTENVIRSFSAEDIPITDTLGIINATNVEQSLEEIKLRLNKIYEDLYVANRYGVELSFCNVKKENNSLVDCVTHDLTLKISAGYIDVNGERIEIDNDIYLASTSTTVKVNSSSTEVYTNLGASTTPYAIYDSSTDGSGTVWRVFIDINGKIILKENSIARPQYYFQDKIKGWYDITSVARCIGKFKVKKSINYFIEKQSVVNTIDRTVNPNEIIIMHGTMCPDGTIPCDGKWHDTIGDDYNSYSTRPAISEWFNHWYEETPNLWGRTIKMPQSNGFSVGQFTLAGDGAVVSGGSADTGLSGGNDVHVHSHPHSHGTGTIKTVESGAHAHSGTEITFPTRFVDETIQVEQDTTSNSIAVTRSDHDHVIVVSGGKHSHNSSDFSGSTAILSGTDANTAETSSWAPYKEVLFCIRK